MSLLQLHRDVEEEPPELPALDVALDRTEPSPSPHIAALLDQVDRLLVVPGVAFSPRFDEVRKGVRALAVLETTLATDAIDTVVAATRREDPGSPASHPAVLAALTDVRHSAAATVQTVLLAELHAEVARTAERNHAAVAAAFDGLVATLAHAATLVDLRTTEAELPERSADERAAWHAAARTARLLDEHAALLVLAARLAGSETRHESHRPGTDTDEWLQLTVDTRGWHRRLVWDAWDAPVDNVAGVWGWLLLAGFELRATPLEGVTAYPRPSGAAGEAEDEVRRRSISWARASALLASGCLALGVAVGCSAVSVGFFVAAVLEPRDVLAAVREALIGVMLLSAGVTSGLTWATFAAVAYDLGTVELARAPVSRTPEAGRPPWASHTAGALRRLGTRRQYSFFRTK